MSIDEVINFYKTFNRYKNNTYQELYNYLIQPYELKQFKIFKDNKIYGFVNWAFVNQLTQDNFLTTGRINNWCNGDIMLHVDFVANKNVKKIMSWLKNNSAKKLGLNKNLYWVRLNSKNKIKTIVKKKIKDNWLWVV